MEQKLLNKVLSRLNREELGHLMNELTDEEFNTLYPTLKNTFWSPIVSLKALKKMINLELMYETFKDDRCCSIRRYVIHKMKDLNLIYETFKNDREEFVRRDVVCKMKDLNLMYETFKNDDSWLVRSEVVKNMKDIELMYKTFKDDKDEEVRRVAEEIYHNYKR